ncbi:unnamed protein product, partial [Effrenium voratum]
LHILTDAHPHVQAQLHIRPNTCHSLQDAQCHSYVQPVSSQQVWEAFRWLPAGDATWAYLCFALQAAQAAQEAQIRRARHTIAGRMASAPGLPGGACAPGQVPVLCAGRAASFAQQCAGPPSTPCALSGSFAGLRAASFVQQLPQPQSFSLEATIPSGRLDAMRHAVLEAAK